MRVFATVFILGSFAAVAQPLSKSEWYRSLRVPGSYESCCDVSDCAPHASRFDKASQRWIVITAEGELPVDPWRILADKEPYDGVSSYACVRGTRVLCFIPGKSGG